MAKATTKKAVKTAEDVVDEIAAEDKASKKATKKDAKKPAKKEKKERAARGSAIADGKITLLVKENPKREGSSAHKRYELYRKHKDIASYLKAGGKRSSLRYDEKHEYIKLSNVKTKAELKEE